MTRAELDVRLVAIVSGYGEPVSTMQVSAVARMRARQMEENPHDARLFTQQVGMALARLEGEGRVGHVTVRRHRLWTPA